MLEDERLSNAVREVLATLDTDRPLFLFLNLAEAHKLWDGVPEGHPWLPASAGEHQFPDDAERFWQGDAATQRTYLGEIDPLYTWGVERADRTLSRAMAHLEQGGWLTGDSRVLLTTDHGEMLGEHGWVGHGRQVYEPNNRTFLVTVGDDLPPMPEPVNAMEVYDLLLPTARWATTRSTPSPSTTTSWRASRRADAAPSAGWPSGRAPRRPRGAPAPTPSR